MLKEYEQPLVLEPQPSAVLNYYLICVHLLALFAVLLAALSLVVQVLCAGCIALHFIYQKNTPVKYPKLIWLQENDWHLYNKQGAPVDARLTPWCFLSSGLVMLVLKTEQGKQVSVLLPYDALDKENFRRLKLRLTTLKPKYLRPSDTDSSH